MAKMPEDCAKARAHKQDFHKTSIRAKVRFKGLAKNTARVITPFAQSNLWMARRKLIAMMEQVRPQAA